MGDLFDTNIRYHEPLASRMRPRTLDEYVGQEHIVGKGRLLRRAIQADQLTSVIFYGPPGSGKTTLARVIANHTSSNFITLNAVLTGVADIRKAISDAEEQRRLYNRKTILFVDEVHRWNKSQQDALLPWVENGTIILIGATTENPFFEVNKALVSRSRVFQLKGLTKDDLMKAASQAIKDTERGYGHWKVSFEEGALEHLVETANGDARSLLNALELAVETTPEEWDPEADVPVPPYGSEIYISRETAEESIQKKVVLYDRDGDYHYDIISAFIKSLRGRDPDAACYWLARMVKAGEDPSFIFRRMLISACEDTGLADPHAISVVSSCAEAFDRVGLPEGKFFLAHAALYLATAPKSNSSMAFFDALSAVEKEDAEVPNHLRDASRDAEGFGHGAGYLYPHAYRDHWVAQQYLPDSLVGRVFYTPSTQGYEKTIRDEVLSRRELQISSLLEEKNPDSNDVKAMTDRWWNDTGHFKGLEKTEENLTYSPENKKNTQVFDRAEAQWRQRLDSNKAELLLLIRNTMTGLAGLKRHHRSLIWNADDALLLFDIKRKTPEGFTAGTCHSQAGIEVLKQYEYNLDEIDKPELSLIDKSTASLSAECFENTLKPFGDVAFDRLFFRDIFASKDDITHFVSSIKTVRQLDPKAVIVICQRIPSGTQRISRLIKEQILSQEITEPDLAEALDLMEKAEDSFFTDSSSSLFNWNSTTIREAFEEAGLMIKSQEMVLNEKRRIRESDIGHWFNSSSTYGKAVEASIGKEMLQKISSLLMEEAKKQLFSWKTPVLFITCEINNLGVK